MSRVCDDEGQQIVHVDVVEVGSMAFTTLLDAAMHGVGELRVAARELRDEQALCAAVYGAMFMALTTAGGVRHVPDSEDCERMIDAAARTGSLPAVIAAAGPLTDPQVRAVAANLAACWQEQMADRPGARS